MGKTVCVYRLRYREKKERERRELYMREKFAPLPAPLASGHLYICTGFPAVHLVLVELCVDLD